MADAAAHGHDDHHDTRGFFTRWFMSTNHKDIGILYLFTAGLAGLISVSFTVYMRMELQNPGVQYMCLEGARFLPAGDGDVCTPNGHLWNVLITYHGVLMMFFVVIPALFGGFGNYFMPLQLGAPDMAFPRLNNLSYWLYVCGVALGIASLALVAVYPFAKRFTWWPQVFLGLAFNWGVMLAYAAHMGRLDAAPVVAWVAGIAWTIFYDTIYAHQDADDDALIGVKSTARLFGDRSPAILAGFALVTVAVLAVAVALTGRNLLMGWAGVLALGLHLTWQLRSFQPDQGAVCLRLFRSNRDAGLILALFLAIAGLA